MNHIQILQTNRDLYLPADLSECDYRQYTELSALILRYQCGDITYHDFKVHAVYKLLELQPVKGGIDDDLKFSNIYLLSQLVDSFFETNVKDQKVIKQYYIHNPIPQVRGAFNTYHGPSDEFNNVKFGEYVDGLGYFIDFHDTGDISYLYLLFAVFYRRKKKGIALAKYLDRFDGDVRMRYNPSSVAARAKHFEKQHIGLIYGFYLLFASVQKYITTAVLTVEGKEIDLAVLFEEPVTKVKDSGLPGLGMRGVMHAFSESGVYGNLNQVREVPLWEVLLRMYELNKKSKDFEANQTK